LGRIARYVAFRAVEPSKQHHETRDQEAVGPPSFLGCELRFGTGVRIGRPRR
jgi:hypothetical protein